MSLRQQKVEKFQPKFHRTWGTDHKVKWCLRTLYGPTISQFLSFFLSFHSCEKYFFQTHTSLCPNQLTGIRNSCTSQKYEIDCSKMLNTSRAAFSIFHSVTNARCALQIVQLISSSSYIERMMVYNKKKNFGAPVPLYNTARQTFLGAGAICVFSFCAKISKDDALKKAGSYIV